MLEVVKKIVSVTVALGDNAAKMLFLFFQRLTFTMASFCASCQRHEISITPHETNGVSAVWGMRRKREAVCRRHTTITIDGPHQLLHI